MSIYCIRGNWWLRNIYVRALSEKEAIEKLRENEKFLHLLKAGWSGMSGMESSEVCLQMLEKGTLADYLIEMGYLYSIEVHE